MDHIVSEKDMIVSSVFVLHFLSCIVMEISVVYTYRALLCSLPFVNPPNMTLIVLGCVC